MITPLPFPRDDAKLRLNINLNVLIYGCHRFVCLYKKNV